MALYKQAKSECWYYDFRIAGKRYRGSTKETTKSRARAFESKLMAEILKRGPSAVPKKPPTLQELSVRFLKWVDECSLDADTKRYYKNGWRLLKDKDIVRMRISDITPDDADRLRFGGSPSNGNNARKTLRRMLYKAQEWKLLYEVPVVPLLEETPRTRLILPQEEKALLAVANQPCRDVLILELDTGMRPYREVCPMRWEYVDWTNRQYYVYSSKSKKGRRWVPLSDRAYQLLLARYKGQNEGWVFPARNKQSKTGHTTTVYKAYEKARIAAGIPENVVLYCGRHTFGTLAMAESRNPAAVRDAMGHEELKTTMAYQHHEHVSIIREVVNRKNENLYGHTFGHTGSQVN